MQVQVKSRPSWLHDSTSHREERILHANSRLGVDSCAFVNRAAVLALHQSVRRGAGLRACRRASPGVPREKQSLSCGITGGARRFFPAPKLLNKNWVEGTFMLIAGGLGILVVFCLLLSIVQAPREIGR
jgi:hypothetical protein